MYEAKIILDSVNSDGDRLTTFEVTYPRFVHSELMTHRVFSRNSSSSRAIPNVRLLKKIVEDPAEPVWWGKNQSGMQASEELVGDSLDLAKKYWLEARNSALRWSQALSDLGVHKQICNRIVEPWMWITVIITATEFNNFFNLQCHLDAQPEIRHFAEMMQILHQRSQPQVVEKYNWHLPYLVQREKGEFHIVDQRRISVARCARVSYLTHDGEHDPEKDIELADQLRQSGHWSPFEHQAVAIPGYFPSGNFTGGWRQFRKTFSDENRTKIKK